LPVLLNLILDGLERSRRSQIGNLGFWPLRRFEESSVELLDSGEEDERFEVEDEGAEDEVKRCPRR